MGFDARCKMPEGVEMSIGYPAAFPPRPALATSAGFLFGWCRGFSASCAAFQKAAKAVETDEAGSFDLPSAFQ